MPATNFCRAGSDSTLAAMRSSSGWLNGLPVRCAREPIGSMTALIAAVRPEEFLPREKELLRLAKEWMPRLPFDKVHLLIVDEIGKNISGTGMDTNVVGRKYNDHKATPNDAASTSTRREASHRAW